jgi:tripeptidyl-peptidase I
VQVVAAYLQQSEALPLNQSSYNSSGRAYPDVSALGHNMYITINGSYSRFDGTSISSPVWAGNSVALLLAIRCLHDNLVCRWLVYPGIIGLINAYRSRAGQRNVGFVNPLLYQVYAEAPEAFTDITSGDNYCGSDDWNVCYCADNRAGYSAGPGWDAVTGLGTPVFPKLLAAIQAIDNRRQAATIVARTTPP